MNTMFQARRLFVATLIAAMLLIVSGCQAAQPTEEAAHEPGAVHWAYEGEEGPDHWGELSDDFVLCSTGAQQSPVDIGTAADADLADIAFHYQTSPLTILNNGHTVQASYAEGSSIELDGSAIEVDGGTYQLVQFHFHTPSEHAINGAAADAELHLVHRSDDGKLAVVGVLIYEGAENAALAPIVGNLPDEADEQLAPAGVTVNAADLLPASHLTIRYSGSLTTPPCSEGVAWNVMVAPIEMSADQLAALEAIMGHNARPIQPLGERDIVEDTTGQ
jgi:carbonic anhydrase